jgi:hypothetical protein
MPFEKLADAVKALNDGCDKLTARADAWGSWKEWNDEYTKMLQKRNAAQRALDKSWADPVAYKRMQEKVAKLEQDCRVFFNNPDRPQVSSTQAFGRQR